MLTRPFSESNFAGIACGGSLRRGALGVGSAETFLRRRGSDCLKKLLSRTAKANVAGTLALPAAVKRMCDSRKRYPTTSSYQTQFPPIAQEPLRSLRNRPLSLQRRRRRSPKSGSTSRSSTGTSSCATRARRKSVEVLYERAPPVRRGNTYGLSIERSSRPRSSSSSDKLKRYARAWRVLNRVPRTNGLRNARRSDARRAEAHYKA